MATRVPYVNPTSTDQEVIDQIEHAYPNLGGALAELLRRYQILVDKLPPYSHEPDEAPLVKVGCAHCGSRL